MPQHFSCPWPHFPQHGAGGRVWGRGARVQGYAQVARTSGVLRSSSGPGTNIWPLPAPLCNIPGFLRPKVAKHSLSPWAHHLPRLQPPPRHCLPYLHLCACDGSHPSSQSSPVKMNQITPSSAPTHWSGPPVSLRVRAEVLIIASAHWLLTTSPATLQQHPLIHATPAKLSSHCLLS